MHYTLYIYIYIYTHIHIYIYIYIRKWFLPCFYCLLSTLQVSKRSACYFSLLCYTLGGYLDAFKFKNCSLKGYIPKKPRMEKRNLDIDRSNTDIDRSKTFLCFPHDGVHTNGFLRVRGTLSCNS